MPKHHLKLVSFPKEDSSLLPGRVGAHWRFPPGDAADLYREVLLGRVPSVASRPWEWLELADYLPWAEKDLDPRLRPVASLESYLRREARELGLRLEDLLQAPWVGERLAELRGVPGLVLLDALADSLEGMDLEDEEVVVERSWRPRGPQGQAASAATDI